MTKDTESTWVPVAAVAVLAVVVGGLILRDAPLESQRPPEGGAVPQVAQRNERLMARLWQDPLHAIQSDWYQLIDFVNEYERLPVAKELPETIHSRGHGVFTLRLLAIMPDTPYVEDREKSTSTAKTLLFQH